MKSKYLYCVGKENFVNNCRSHNYYDCLCYKSAVKAIKNRLTTPNEYGFL